MAGWIWWGGRIRSTGRPTCGNKEYDFFVVGVRLDPAVAGVALVTDTGAEPHSVVRLWLRAAPRRDTVRVLVSPPRAAAVPPLGCFPQAAAEGWDGIADPELLAGGRGMVPPALLEAALDDGYCT